MLFNWLYLLVLKMRVWFSIVQIKRKFLFLSWNMYLHFTRLRLEGPWTSRVPCTRWIVGCLFLRTSNSIIKYRQSKRDDNTAEIYSPVKSLHANQRQSLLMVLRAGISWREDLTSNTRITESTWKVYSNPESTFCVTSNRAQNILNALDLSS